MGLRPLEVKSLFYKDYILMLTGYQRRMDKKWNGNRHLMWAIMNYGGMGLNEATSPQDIWPLAMDKEDIKRVITTIPMAMELFKEF